MTVPSPHPAELPVLLVAPGTSYRVESFARAAARLGIALEIATDLPAAMRRFGLPLHAVRFTSAEESLAALGERRFQGAVAADERSAWLAAQLGSRCRIPYHEPRGAAAARDKRILRRELSAAGVAVPRWALLPPALDPAAAAPPSFPCVVKPPMLSGSQGVIRADDEGELARAVARVRRILARHPSELSGEPGFFELLVEEYVAGEEVAVEALLCRGAMEVVAIFDKPDPLEGPFFEETLYVTPSRKPEALQQRIAETARDAALALGLGHGPIHAELRVDADGRPVLIEIAARSIGGLCSRVLAPRLGSLEERLLLLAAGRELPPLPVDPPASGVMMIPVPRSGVLRGVAGVEAARAVPGIEAVEIAIAPGEAVRALPEGSSYLGFLFARGDAPAEVEAALRQAHAELRIDLKPLLA